MLPSRKEGFPNVWLEASLRGVLMVASPVGPFPELQRLFRERFREVPESPTVNELAQAIREASRFGREGEIPRRAQRLVLERFPAQDMVDAWVRFFQHICRPDPEVSVIVPVLQDDPGLRRTLASLLCQDTNDMEVLVVSTGLPGPCLRETRETLPDNRWRTVVRNPQKVSLAGLMNIGCAQARGRFVGPARLSIVNGVLAFVRPFVKTKPQLWLTVTGSVSMNRRRLSPNQRFQLLRYTTVTSLVAHPVCENSESLRQLWRLWPTCNFVEAVWEPLVCFRQP